LCHVHHAQAPHVSHWAARPAPAPQEGARVSCAPWPTSPWLGAFMCTRSQDIAPLVSSASVVLRLRSCTVGCTSQPCSWVGPRFGTLDADQCEHGWVSAEAACITGCRPQGCVVQPAGLLAHRSQMLACSLLKAAHERQHMSQPQGEGSERERVMTPSAPRPYHALPQNPPPPHLQAHDVQVEAGRVWLLAHLEVGVEGKGQRSHSSSIIINYRNYHHSIITADQVHRIAQGQWPAL